MRARACLAVLGVPLAAAAVLWLYLVSRPAGGGGASLEPGALPAIASGERAGPAPPGLSAAVDTARVSGATREPTSERAGAGERPADSLGPDEAQLVVLLRGAGSAGEEPALEGVALELRPLDEPLLELARVSRSFARLGESPRTDEEGRASFVLPSGRAWSVRVLPRLGRWNGTRTEVRALAPGERYEATLLVPLGGDLLLTGRVLQAEDSAPIAGARVLARALGVPRIAGSGLPRGSEARGETTTDEEGRFRLPSTSWEGSVLLVEAAGFSPRTLLPPEIGPDGEPPPLEVRLERGGVLELELRDSAGLPLSGLQAVSRAAAAPVLGLERVELPPIERSATSDAEGRLRLEDLPPGLSLSLELVDLRLARGRGEVVWRESDALVLEAGERKRMVLVVPPPSSLAGRLVDQRGRPVGNYPVWLAPDRGQELVLFTPHQRPFREGVSDPEGRFAIPRVPEGRWWVGPAPLSANDPRAVGERVAPLAQAVLHRSGGEESSAEVRVTRGLLLAGAVLDPDGRPLEGVIVRAAALAAPLALEARSDERGSFAIGPLVPGEFRVVARPHAELGLAGPRPAEYEAGRTDLELVLVRTASIEGRVHGGGGSAGEVEVALVPEDPTGGAGWRATKTSEGRFRFEGIAPGSYALVASREDGQIALLRGLALAAGQDLGGLGLDLARGARLSVRLEGGRERWLCDASLAGLLVDFATCAPGEAAELVVPAGRVLVRALEADGRAAEEELDLEPGRRRILRLRPR